MFTCTGWQVCLERIEISEIGKASDQLQPLMLEEKKLVSFGLLMGVLRASIFLVPWSVSATDVRRDLHWLPIRQRFIYKLSVLTYKALHTGQPCYLTDLIDSYEPSRCL